MSFRYPIVHFSPLSLSFFIFILLTTTPWHGFTRFLFAHPLKGILVASRFR